MSARHRILLLASFLLAGLASSAPVHAQRLARPDSAFAFLLGTWAGEARPVTREGELRIYQTETVRVVASGEGIAVEGGGYALENGIPGAKPVFSAFGVIRRTPSGYRIQAVTHEGRYTDAAVDLKPGGFDWYFDVPGGKVRFEMRIDEQGRWHETGAFSPDGQRWMPTIDMRLTRTAPFAP